MDPLDLVSKAIVGITKNYGKKVQNKTECPKLEKSEPLIIEGDKYRLGFAREEIMPDMQSKQPYYIAGHGSGHKMENILSPVYVHAIWVDCGNDEGVIWISADIVGLTNIEVSVIRERVMASSVIKGCKSVNFSSTHSHSGIDTVGYWGKPFASIPSDGKNKDYMELLFTNAVKCAEKAFLARKEGKLYSAIKPVPDGFFAKRKFPDKHEFVARLRFAPSDGSNETWIMSIGAHPNSLGGNNRSLSGEYPYFMREKIKEKSGADVFFGTGALGGMDAAILDEKDNVNCVKLQGELFADAALSIENDRELEPKIKLLQRKFYYPVCNYVLTLLAMKGTMSFKAYPCKKSDIGISMLTEMTYITLGDQKILCLPGENFANTVYGAYLDKDSSATGLGAEANPKPLADIAKDKNMIVFGNTNDMTGYVVPYNDFILNPTQPYLVGTKDRFGDNHYHETNSMGPKSQQVIADVFAEVVADFS